MMTNIDFIGKRKIAIVFSLSLIILSAFFIFVFKGLNYGVDFTGGALVQIKFKQKITVFDLEKMRSSFKKENLNVDIQYLGEMKNELMIKTRLAKEGDVSQTIEKIIKRDFKDFEVSRSEMVGPTIGKELKKLALLSVVIANIGILLYLSFRFEYRFAIGAVVALVHDVFITTGILSMANYEFNSSIIAALLTISGYSVNDTVVIFDRIRENMKTMKKISFLEIVNKSINQTLNRTLLTSLTVFFATVSLFVFGGEVIHGFAFVFLVGIIIGTYSTIYIASAFVVQWHLYDEKKKKQELQIPKYRR
ncbi:protein translocase subunit SecF [bacterium]|nr:protein translocase subunit SecF [bacterium]